MVELMELRKMNETIDYNTIDTSLESYDTLRIEDKLKENGKMKTK